MIGCLCLHGFTGSPAEVEPIAERLRRKKGWLVYTPVLPGHGEDDELKNGEGSTWIYTADRAANEMLKHVDELYVIGFSMGGMLACYLAAKYPIKKLVLVNAAAYYVNRPQIIENVRTSMREGMNDPWMALVNDKAKETSIRSVFEFMKTVRTVRPYVREVTASVLIAQGEKDILVPEKSAAYLYDNIGSKYKRLYMYEQSNHFVFQDVEKLQVIRDIEHFLKGNETT
ncbi:carboxylesterase [Geomicrobium sp. JCM 19039]|uniref:alpha/beta hydrolase n=1 Tax=Geomicrobium sp. JCM 19039 TaxID=1460636 RepID=UPI00045F39CE|nr:alpha/beta fold hydrolase [Geomicrobium sp. JCM 19039]GAK11738.1 carboxylesterase [Geomicrobium sp. JCM 19039]